MPLSKAPKNIQYTNAGLQLQAERGENYYHIRGMFVFECKSKAD